MLGIIRESWQRAKAIRTHRPRCQEKLCIWTQAIHDVKRARKKKIIMRFEIWTNCSHVSINWSTPHHPKLLDRKYDKTKANGREKKKLEKIFHETSKEKNKQKSEI